MTDFMRNAERYYDPTAGAALKNIEKGERMDWKVGDIVIASKPGNPVEGKYMVLANDGYVLTGCVLFTREMPNSVPVLCEVTMYANPYRLAHVSLGTNDIRLVRVATEEELEKVREGVGKALGFEATEEPEEEEEDDDLDDFLQDQAKRLIEAETKVEVYKGLYEGLLQRCIKTA